MKGRKLKIRRQTARTFNVRLSSKWKLVVFILLFLLVLTILLYFMKEGLIIKKINCTSQYGSCNRELTTKLDQIRPSNLFDSKKQLNKILSSEVYVKKYSIRYQMPDAYLVNVVERKPIFALGSLNNSWLEILDDQGYVLNLVQETKLPTVMTTASLQNPGSKVDSKTLFALTLTYNLYTYYHVTTPGKMDTEKLNVTLDNGIQVIFPLQGDREILLGSLTLILNRLNNDSRNFTIDGMSTVKEIDLRYKNPVLR